MYESIIVIIIAPIMCYSWYRVGLAKGKLQSKSNIQDTSVCSCGHQYSCHLSNGKCNVQTTRIIDGKRYDFLCPCVRYDGIPPAHMMFNE